MKAIAAAIPAILLTLFMAGALALPNLRVSSLEYAPESHRIVATVTNDSQETAENFIIGIFVDGVLYETSSSESTITLEPNSTLSFPADFEYDGKTHYLTAAADLYEEISESNEKDNSMTIELKGWGSPSDSEEGLPTGNNGTAAGQETNPWDFPLLAAGGLLLMLALAYIVVRARGGLNA